MTRILKNVLCVGVGLIVFCGCVTVGPLPKTQLPNWVDAVALAPPRAAEEAVTTQSAGAWPEFEVRADAPGKRTVRVSLPFPWGVLEEGQAFRVVCTATGAVIKPDVRVLTVHPGSPPYVRRAMATFQHDFDHAGRYLFQVESRARRGARRCPLEYFDAPFTARIGGTTLTVAEDKVSAAQCGEIRWEAVPIAPERALDASSVVVEVVEEGDCFLWVRVLVPDAVWPRIIEIRADALGAVAVRAHVQRMLPEDGYAPDLGWRIWVREPVRLAGLGKDAESVNKHDWDFSTGETCILHGERLNVAFPDAHLLKRGSVSLDTAAEGTNVIYWRCREGDHVPFQPAAWRTACFFAGPAETEVWTPLLEPPCAVTIPPRHFEELYAFAPDPDLSNWPALDSTRRFHRDAMACATLPGDDFGNVTGVPARGAFGMNRLNHCPPIFEEYYRSGDARLRDTALLWCSNFHNLSVWWGAEPEGHFGGTRYNNAAVYGGPHEGDTSFMWRSNDAVHFCTKGYDSFFYAYEETGDPRMSAALRWQTAYAASKVHTDQGECRNIGDALDFVRLYRFTGEQHYLDQAMRLFRELRAKLMPDGLFSQGGQPIEPDPPFIDRDDFGYQHPFAKPYIIGYALHGLPLLARHAPEEPRLHEVVRAVAAFLAAAQDPIGGWRYPHPRSSRVIIDQGMEHAVQLARAAECLEQRGENIEPLLDAIERVLQARVNGYLRSGAFLSGLGPWETEAGAVPGGKTIQDLYRKPEDRDTRRDYTDGRVTSGDSSPEGAVYFTEVLECYLRHRDAQGLFNMTPELRTVLDRVAPPAASGEAEAGAEYPDYGVERGLPSFAARQAARMHFALAYDPDGGVPFDTWRERARAKVLECLLEPPPEAPFDPVVVAREDRGGYEARKLVFNVSAFCRIPAYLLVPKGEGPFPAIVALHDHGAHFSIGKEKAVRPFGVPRDVLRDAEQWVAACYGGRWIGDELAQRGYVVFAADALFWGERGRREGVAYEEQQTLAANLLQLGMTWPGVITWDDIRSVAFVASLPEVDPARIGAAGLSMGCHRTWMLCAATDRVAAGAAICWMGTTEALMAPGNNQTKGQSAFSMLVPNLRNFLDYPDVAAIACPKPMLFYNGAEDSLFPVPGVEAAYARIRRVYDSQNASGRLVTKLWPVPHVFNVEMQEEAFAWLDRWLKP